MTMKTCASFLQVLMFVAVCHATTYPKYYLNKESRKDATTGISPAFHDASYWTDENGKPGEAGAPLDPDGDYIARDGRILQTDNVMAHAVDPIAVHSLTLGEVGGTAVRFDCYFSQWARLGIAGDGLVLANGKYNFSWKPQTVDTKVTVTASKDNPFLLIASYADTAVTFLQEIVAAPGTAAHFYDAAKSASSSPIELKGDYSQYMGELWIGEARNYEKTNEIKLSCGDTFPGKIVLKPTGLLNIGSSTRILGGLELEDGSGILIKGGALKVTESFSATGTVHVQLPFSTDEVSALLARREYGEVRVLTVPAGEALSVGNFTFEFSADLTRVASVVAAVVDNGDGTKSLCCRLNRPCAYVDPKGSNSNDGHDADHAFKTLAYAVSQFTDGVIYAAEGTYDEGLCDVEEGVTHSRVHVPTNVFLKAVGSVEKTIIVGAPPTDSSKLFGEGATRCVRLDSGAVLKGFTLTGGYGYASETEVTGNRFVNKAGGAVRGRQDSLVMDCIITNNFAANGGGVQGGRFVRCTFRDNYSLNDAKTARSQTKGCDGYGYGSTGEKESYSYFYDCLFDCNADTGILIYNYCYAYNCTFTGTKRVSPQNICSLWNCILTGNQLEGGGQYGVSYYNCLMGMLPANAAKLEHCTLIDDATKVLDATFRPIAGGPAVDTGSNTFYRTTHPVEAGEADYFGGQRIYGGQIDIGCGEYDMRTDFGKALGRSSIITVASASSGVKIADGGKDVLVPGGENVTVSVDATRKRPEYEVEFEVAAEDAVLTVYMDGKYWTRVESGRQVLKFTGNASVRKLTFSCTGTGHATIGSFRGTDGLILLFR